MSIRHNLNQQAPFWIALDQASTSVRAPLVALLAVRMLSLKDFGAFTIAFTTYQIVRGTLGGALGNILLTRVHSRSKLVGSALSIQMLAALGLTVALLIVSRVVSEPVRGSILGLALGLLNLLLFDFLRTLAHSRGLNARAAAASIAWLGSAVTFLSVLTMAESHSVLWVTVVWALSALPGVLILLAQPGLTPRNPDVWWNEYGPTSIRFGADFAMMSAAGQSGSYVLGATTGVADAGALRLAQLPFSPITVWMQASRLYVLPRLGAADSQAAARALIKSTQRFVVLPAIGYAVAAYVVLYSGGIKLFGASMSAASAALLPVGIAAVARVASSVSLMTVQALADGTGLVRIRVVDAAITLVAIVIGGVGFGLSGAAWGHAGANVVMTVMWARLAGTVVDNLDQDGDHHMISALPSTE